MIPESDQSGTHELSRREMLLTTAGAIALQQLTASAAAASESPFIVTPYVQLGDSAHHVREEALTVMWHAAPSRGNWSAEFRSQGNANWIQTAGVFRSTVAVKDIPEHEVFQAVLHPLTPGVLAEYRVLLNGSAVFSGAATSRAPIEKPFRCVVMGDVGTNSEPQKKIAFQVHKAHPEFVLIPGDFVYRRGLISEYREKLFPPYSVAEASPEHGAPLLSSTCILGGRGQHDTEVALKEFPDGHAFFQYWSFPMNGPALIADSPHIYPLSGSAEQEQNFKAAAGRRFPRMVNYSFDWGNTHWVVLDTWNPHIDWTDSHLRGWLKFDLRRAANAKWKIVSSYMPPFNSCIKYPQGQKMRAIVDLFEEAGVDIVFSGYAHSYQRTYPLRFRPDAKPAAPLGDPASKVSGQFTFDKKYDGREHTRADGVLYVVSGCGGNPTLHTPDQTANSKTWQPYTVRYDATNHQFSQLDFNDSKLTVTQIGMDGKALDQFSLTK